MTSTEDLVALCQQCMRSCFAGCPAQSFEDLNTLLTSAAALAPNLNPMQLQSFNQCLQRIYAAQQINDLLAIADEVGFCLQPLLQQLSAPS